MATVDKELREGFKAILEQEMSGLIHSLDQLIEMHDTYGGETMQKTYLWSMGLRATLQEGWMGAVLWCRLCKRQHEGACFTHTSGVNE